MLSLSFSEPVAGFAKSDITGVPAESLGSLMGPVPNADGSVTYQIEYRPGAGIEDTVAPSVAQGAYTDMVGNAGSGSAGSLAVDTAAPVAPGFAATAYTFNKAALSTTGATQISGTSVATPGLTPSAQTIWRKLVSAVASR